jgi:hypothetical protein
MDISNYSLLLFIITTLLYISSIPIIGKPALTLELNDKTGIATLTDQQLLNYYSDCFYKLSLFLLIVICTQLGLNITYMIDKCKSNAGKNVGAAVIYTLIPWIFIFGVMIVVIFMYPRLKSIFSDVIGYFFIAKSANNLLLEILQDTNIDNIIQNEKDPIQKIKYETAAKDIMKIYGNKSILINEMFPDNFISIWEGLKSLMKPGMYENGGPENKKQELLNLIIYRDNIGEALWYIYTAMLVSSIVYYNLATRECVKDVNSIKVEYDEYLKEQEEREKQEKINNSVVYTVS